jgi:hypothetical protein
LITILSTKLGRALLCLSLAAYGCAGSHPQPATLAPAALPDLALARQLAPDYAARVDAAWQAAKAEPSEQARAAEQHRAQLLALAARAEAERVEILRQVPAFEARIERARLARAHAERERIAVVQARVHEQAAANEQREAQWAYQVLAAGTVTAQQRDRLWEFLTRRAQALCAAARMLGAPAAELNEADLQLTAARTAKLPLRVEQARHALRVAQRALGRARAALAPGHAERRDLHDRLSERGLAPLGAQAEAGVIELGAAGSPQLTRRVGLLNDLLEAFPHGPILVRCGRRGTCAASWFTPGLRERVRIEDVSSEPGAELVRVVLPAYAEGTAVRE